MMNHYVLKDRETGTIVAADFDKVFSTETYEVFFNTESGLEVLRGRQEHPDPFTTELPLLLDIGVMGTCNNRCNFCYQGDIQEPDMTLENFKLIIDQVKHHVNQVALGGRGDPNKHEQFEEIVTYARENNVVPNYTTSGNNITAREIEISKMCGAVAVSDYGNVHTYDAIQLLMDAGIKTNIHLIFSAATYQKCVMILYGHNPWKSRLQRGEREFFDLKKLNAVIFLLFKPQGRGADCTDLTPNKLQIKTISDLILNSKNQVSIGMDSCLANHVFKNTDVPDIHKLTLDSCEGSRMSAYITHSMQMMPCSYANGIDYAQDITEKRDISYIWNRSMKFKKFRSVLKKNCFSCPAGF